MIDDGLPMCETTGPPTMSPSVSIDMMLKETEAPTVAVASEVQGSERSGADKDTLSLFKLVSTKLLTPGTKKKVMHRTCTNV